jgi:hypothetical protein
MKLSDVTVNNLSEVPATQAFEWVKTGAWTKVTFLLWLDDVKQESYDNGWVQGLEQGRDGHETC